MEKSITVIGMSCGHCAAAVEEALKAVSGVTEAKVDLAAKTARCKLEKPVEDSALRQAIEEIGYAVETIG